MDAKYKGLTVARDVSHFTMIELKWRSFILFISLLTQVFCQIGVSFMSIEHDIQPAL